MLVEPVRSIASLPGPLVPGVGEVDDLRRRPKPGPSSRGQQLVDRHVVEAGQALEPGHRDGPLAPLVGAEHRRLELLLRGRLDLLQRQPLLPPDGAQPLADLATVRGRVVALRPTVVRHSCVALASPLGSPFAQLHPCPSRHHTDGGHGAQSIGLVISPNVTVHQAESERGQEHTGGHRRRLGAEHAGTESDAREAELDARGRTSHPRVRREQSGRASEGESPPMCARQTPSSTAASAKVRGAATSGR